MIKIIYLCNGLSESMKKDITMKIIPFPISEKEFINFINKVPFESVIGHQDLADVLSDITGTTIKYNRRAIQVDYDDIIILISLNGRLPEHPTIVEYQGRLNYSIIRFERQTTSDFAKSLDLINKLKK